MIQPETMPFVGIVQAKKMRWQDEHWSSWVSLNYVKTPVILLNPLMSSQMTAEVCVDDEVTIITCTPPFFMRALGIWDAACLWLCLHNLTIEYPSSTTAARVRSMPMFLQLIFMYTQTHFVKLPATPFPIAHVVCYIVCHRTCQAINLHTHVNCMLEVHTSVTLHTGEFACGHMCIWHMCTFAYI